MKPYPWNVLFLCAGNSARSILAEALLNVLGGNRLVAFSAGSHPSGRVQPMALDLAIGIGYDPARIRSKSWDEFAADDAPEMQLVITVCGNAAGETCPLWLGAPITAHWGVPDPVAVDGSEQDRRQAYRRAFETLRLRVEALVDLSQKTITEQSLREQLSNIGRMQTP